MAQDEAARGRLARTQNGHARMRVDEPEALRRLLMKPNSQAQERDSVS